MVRVHVREDSRKRLSSLFADGHAGWADAGADVVCAAVSAILQAAWLGFVEVAGVELTASRAAGRLDLRWPLAARDDVATQTIARTAAVAIEHLSAQFPDHVALIREHDDG